MIAAEAKPIGSECAQHFPRESGSEVYRGRPRPITPPLCLNPATASLLPFAPLFENTTNIIDASPSSSGSNLYQRRGRGGQISRFHPASVPQQLSRGMGKNWGHATAGMTLETTVSELHRDGIDDELIDTVKEIFSAGFTIGGR